MGTQGINNSTDHPSSRSKDIRLSEYYEIIHHHRRFIGYFVGGAFIISLLVSLLLPKMYIATARILPPEKSNSGLAALISDRDDPLTAVAGSLMGTQTSAGQYIGILKSRSVADALNQKFSLKELYDKKYIEDVYKKLAERSIIKTSKKERLISVTVEDRDPQRAADMANAYVGTLDQINRNLNITRGKRKRLFLEGRLKQVRGDLYQAEVELKKFREKYHLVSMEEQARVAIEGAAIIKEEIVAAQTELEVFKQFGTERQIEAVTLKAKIEELQKQLRAIEYGGNTETGGERSNTARRENSFYIPFDEVPRLGLQLMRLNREAKIQEKLFEILTAQYEMARIEEAKDVNTIQVLDHAVVPEKKIRPKRLRIIIVSTFIALVCAVVIVFGRRYYEHTTL